MYILFINQINPFWSTLSSVPFTFTSSFSNLFSRFSYSTSLMLAIFILLNRSPYGRIIVISYTSWFIQMSASTTLFSLPLICLTSKSNSLKKAIHCAFLELTQGWFNIWFCWCICNFGMYSLVYLLLYPDVCIGIGINIINSCKANHINSLLKVREIVPTI